MVRVNGVRIDGCLRWRGGRGGRWLCSTIGGKTDVDKTSRENRNLEKEECG